MDIVDIIFSLPEQLKNLSATLKDFLFASINIGGADVSFWTLLAGVGVVALIIISLVNG